MLQSQNNPANLKQPASTKNFLSYFSKKQTGQLLNQLTTTFG
jgi:hypothetical protein